MGVCISLGTFWWCYVVVKGNKGSYVLSDSVLSIMFLVLSFLNKKKEQSKNLRKLEKRKRKM